jgi:hypothetical protein
MATDCYTQLGFGFQPKLVVDFAGGTLTTDAGLLLVREFDEQLGLSADVVSRLTDTRDARYVTHELDALVRQRVYQIGAGYEDSMMQRVRGGADSPRERDGNQADVDAGSATADDRGEQGEERCQPGRSEPRIRLTAA